MFSGGKREIKYYITDIVMKMVIITNKAIAFQSGFQLFRKHLTFSRKLIFAFASHLKSHHIHQSPSRVDRYNDMDARQL